MEAISKEPQPIATTSSHDLLSVTSIGEAFGIPSTRMNLILSELGWITKEGRDWLLTEAGKGLGGVQYHDNQSGKYYVRWPATILRNPLLLDSIRPSEGEETTHHQDISNLPPLDDLQFRQRFPATYRAVDGHYVRSKAEMIIDNWLYQYRIAHAYEKLLPIDEACCCDFFINGPRGVYIEYWGLSEASYLSRRYNKTRVYKNHGLQLIELTDDQVSHIDDVLPRELRACGIPIAVE